MKKVPARGKYFPKVQKYWGLCISDWFNTLSISSWDQTVYCFIHNSTLVVLGDGQEHCGQMDR